MRLLRITLWQLSATRARSGGVAWGWVGRRFGHPAFCLCGDFVPRATSFATHKNVFKGTRRTDGVQARSRRVNFPCFPHDYSLFLWRAVEWGCWAPVLAGNSDSAQNCARTLNTSIRTATVILGSRHFGDH